MCVSCHKKHMIPPVIEIHKKLKTLRKKVCRQVDIGGISEETVRRIEKGTCGSDASLLAYCKGLYRFAKLKNQKEIFLQIKQLASLLGSNIGQKLNAEMELTQNWPLTLKLDYEEHCEWIGRKKELEQLKSYLIATNDSRPVLISGMPGVGKTQLAINFAYQYKTLFKHVLCINAEGDDISAEFGNLSTVLNLSNTVDKAHSVRKALEFAEPSLLIFDNASSEKTIHRHFPCNKQVRIIITSISRSFAGTKLLLLRPMEKIESEKLLLVAINSKLSSQELKAATKLCMEFGNLPIALRLASHYMAFKDVTPSELLTWINEYGSLKIIKNQNSTIDYDKNIVQAFEQVLDMIYFDIKRSKDSEENIIVERTIWILGLIAPIKISEQLVIDVVCDVVKSDKSSKIQLDTYIIRNTFVSLVGRSLADRSQGYLLIHRLMIDFFFEKIPDKKMSQIVLSYLQKLIEATKTDNFSSENLKHLLKGLDLLESVVDKKQRDFLEQKLLIEVISAQMSIWGYVAPEIEHLFKRADRFLNLELSEELFALMFVDWLGSLIRAELPKAFKKAKKLQKAAKKFDNPSYSAAAFQSLGATFSFQGEHEKALKILRQGIDISDRNPEVMKTTRQTQDSRVTCRTDAARTLHFLGYPEQAMAMVQKGLAVAEGTGNQFNVAFALFNIVMLYQIQGNPEKANKYAELLISQSHNYRQFKWMGKIMQGWAIANQKYTDGVEQFEFFYQKLKDIQANISRVADCGIISELHLKYGDLKKTRCYINEGITLANQTGEQYYAPELFRLQGELELAIPNGSEVKAYEYYEQGLQLAAKQKALWHQLRLTTSVANLLATQSKKKKAYKLLFDVYKKFYEGLSLPPLVEARSLLKKLST